MDIYTDRVKELQIARTIENLKKNNMDAAFLPKAQDVLPMLRYLLEEECTIALGGSSTLVETGALKFVKSGPYNLIDRYEANLSEQQIRERFIAAFNADIFLTSVNAITEGGELYCVDGTSNRVAPILFGPKKVIVIAGWQKIVPTLKDAVNRVKQIAAPANAMRLEKETSCTKTGYCVAPFSDDDNLMAIETGLCDNGICCNFVVYGRQRDKNRISVYIVGDQLGY